LWHQVADGLAGVARPHPLGMQQARRQQQHLPGRQPQLALGELKVGAAVQLHTQRGHQVKVARPASRQIAGRPRLSRPSLVQQTL